MPDADAVHACRIAAISRLASHLERSYGARELTTGDLRQYSEREFSYGWELDVQFSDRDRRIRLFIDENFPFKPPRFELVDRPEFLTWPHVEKDGILCLLTNNAAIASDDPIAVVRELLSDAVGLIESSIAGKNFKDFESEFHTYWNYRITEHGKNFLNLCNLEPGHDAVARLWRGDKIDLIGESDEKLQKWLLNRYGDKFKNAKFERAGILWIPSIPHPKAYPVKVRDVRNLLVTYRQKLVNLLSEDDSTRLVLAGESANGIVLAGVVMPKPMQKDPLGRSINIVTKGFRTGRVPPTLLADRMMSSDLPITRVEVNRADHGWIHGRDRDASQRVLKACRVLVVGCGSLGSPVFEQLVRSGVGSFTLFDPDFLNWANISRHVLGAKHVGAKKAVALAEVFRPEFPHLHFEGYPNSIETQLASDNDLLSRYDLVLNLSGDWAAASVLNLRQTTSSGVPILHGWAERKAMAGHALVVFGKPCLRCGFSATGVPERRITEWGDVPLDQEPDCGGVFEAYGAIDISRTVSLISQLAIDVLLKKATKATYRIWAGSGLKLKERGGNWSEYFKSRPDFRETGELYISDEWPIQANCSVCS